MEILATEGVKLTWSHRWQEGQCRSIGLLGLVILFQGVVRPTDVDMRSNVVRLDSMLQIMTNIIYMKKQD